MKIYFLSSKPCALTLNGVFYGVTDTFERSAEVALSDRVYAQFAPQGELAVGLFLTEALRTDPPEGCAVYLLKDGIAVYAYDFPSADYTLRPIAQLREGDRLATVFRQGKLQLSLQSERGFFNATLPPALEPCTLQFHGELLLVKGEGCLGIYDDSCQALFFEEVEEYELTGNELRATLPLSDSLRRRAKCRYELSKGCALTEFTLEQPPAKEGGLPEGLLAYAFFESVLFKGAYEDFLGEELIADKERIAAFLGEFIAVTLTKDPNECGLIRKKGERLYAVDYFTVEIREGKIVDVRG